MRGRDLILLNPLNPFDRLAVTRTVGGHVPFARLRRAYRSVSQGMSALNTLSWIGCMYLVALLLLIGLSRLAHFSVVLAWLAVAHVLIWLICLVVLVTRRRQLELTPYEVFVLLAEAAFVPAYAVNLSKRLWFRKSLDVPAMAVGLRYAKRIESPSSRELYCLRMSQRLDDIEAEAPRCEDLQVSGGDVNSGQVPNPATRSNTHAKSAAVSAHSQRLWIAEARKCLMTLAPPVGS